MRQVTVSIFPCRNRYHKSGVVTGNAVLLAPTRLGDTVAAQLHNPSAIWKKRFFCGCRLGDTFS